MGELLKHDLDVMKLGNVMADSRFFGCTPPQAVAKILLGRELGMGDVESLTKIHVIKGKPEISAGAIAGAIKKNPRYDYRVKEHTVKECVIDFFELHHDHSDRAINRELIGSYSYTIKDAERAGLLGKDNWRNHPRAMLFARAISQGYRTHCPDVFSCIVYVEGEIPRGKEEIIDVDAPVKEPEPTRYGNGQETTEVFVRPTEDTKITKEICPKKFYREDLEGKRLGDDQDEAVKDYQGKTYTFHLKDKKPDEVKAANSPREYEWLLGVHEVRKRRKAREEEELRELKVALVQEAKELAIHSESKKAVLKDAYKRAGMRPTEGDKSLESFDAKRLERLIPFFIEAEKAASVGKPKAGTRRRSRVSANSRPRGVVGAVLREVRAPGKAERAAKAQVYRERITDHLRSVGNEEQSNQAWRDLCAVVAMPPTMPLHHFGFKVLKRMIDSMRGVTA